MRYSGRLLGLLAVVLAVGVVLLLHLITQPTARRQQRLDAELSLQQWLSELAGELAESSHRKLFPNRAELEQKLVRESRRPSEGLVTLTHALLPGQRPRVLADGVELPFTLQRAGVLSVETAGPVILEYPVDDLTVYWVEPQTARFYRQRRDSLGNTDLVLLNPGLRLESLGFERVNGDRVRIRLQGVDPAGRVVQGVREVRVNL